MLGGGTVDTLVNSITLSKYSCCSSGVANRIWGGKGTGTGPGGLMAGPLATLVTCCGTPLLSIKLRRRLSRSLGFSVSVTWDDEIRAGWGPV